MLLEIEFRLVHFRPRVIVFAHGQCISDEDLCSICNYGGRYISYKFMCNILVFVPNEFTTIKVVCFIYIIKFLFIKKPAP